MPEFPVRDSLGLPWGWTELDRPSPVSQKLAWLDSWSCICRPLSCRLCTAGVPNPGSAPAPVGSFAGLKPCSLAGCFLEWTRQYCQSSFLTLLTASACARQSHPLVPVWQPGCLSSLGISKAKPHPGYCHPKFKGSRSQYRNGHHCLLMPW